MKPDWDKLAEEAHSSVFIADINCSDQEELCQKAGVQGYPTIKVYKGDGSVDDYQGPRSFDGLMEFVDENLAVKCDIASVEATCSDKAPAYVAKWKAKADDVENEIARLSGMLDKSMTPDLKTWLRERLAILQQLKGAGSEEL